MYAPLSDTELLRGSALVAEGRYLGATRLRSEAHARVLELGVLQIDSLWRGAGAPRVVLLLLQAVAGLQSSSDAVFKPGDQGLWLLTGVPGTEGLYRAEGPQRFVRAGDAAIERLRARLRQLEPTPP